MSLPNKLFPFFSYLERGNWNGVEEITHCYCRCHLGITDRDTSEGSSAYLSRVKCMKLALNLPVRGFN